MATSGHGVPTGHAYRAPSQPHAKGAPCGWLTSRPNSGLHAASCAPHRRMRQREHDVYTPTTAHAAAATGMAAQPRPEVRALQAQQPVRAVADRNCTVRSQGLRQVVCRRGVGKGMRSIAVLGRTSSFYCRSFCIHLELACGMDVSLAGRLRSASHALTRRSDGLPLSREAHTRAEVSASCVSAHHAWHHVLPCCGTCGPIC